MISHRCGYIPTDSDICPGAIDRCDYCSSPSDCDASGGTTMQIRFLPSNQLDLACRLEEAKQ